MFEISLYRNQMKVNPSIYEVLKTKIFCVVIIGYKLKLRGFENWYGLLLNKGNRSIYNVFKQHIVLL